MEPFTTVYSTLDAFYSEINLILSHLDYTTSLKSKINGYVNWDILLGEDKKLINNYYKLEPLPFRPLHNSLYVSIVAGYEAFLREFLIIVVQEKEKKGNITDIFLKKHLQLSGLILSFTYTMPSYLNIDTFKIARNLGTCHPKSENILLNPEIAYFLKSILDLTKVLGFLEDCDIVIKTDELGANVTLQHVLNTTNTRETANELLKRISDFTEIRNLVAHTGLTSAEITSSNITELIAFILCISKVLIEETIKKIQK